MKRSTLTLDYFMPPKTQTITITMTLAQRKARARFDHTLAIVNELFMLNHPHSSLSFRARHYGKLYRFRFTNDCNKITNKITVNGKEMSRASLRAVLNSMNDPCFNNKLLKLADKAVNDKKSQFRPPVECAKFFDCADFFNYI